MPQIPFLQQAQPQQQQAPSFDGNPYLAPKPQGQVQSMAPAPVAPYQPTEQEYAAQRYAGQAAALGVPQEYASLGMQSGLRPDQIAASMKYTPGQAAFDPGAHNASLQEVRQGVNRTTVGGGKYGAENIADISVSDRLAAEQGMRAQLEQQEAATRRAAGAQAMLSNEEIKANQRLASAQAAKAEVTKRALAEVDNVSKKKVDQSRYFSNAGVMTSALMGIGSMFEKYGAALRGNFGIRTAMDEAISRDIDSQQQEIAMQGAAATNKLAELTRMYDGDIDSARSALEVLQGSALNAKLGLMEQAATDPAVKETIIAARMEKDADILQKRVELEAADKGTTTESTSSAYMAPRAGSRGGYSLDTKALSKEISANEEVVREQQEKSFELQKQAVDMQKAAGADDEKLYAEASTKLTEIDAADASVEKGLLALGVTIDENGMFQAPPEDPPGLGLVTSAAARESPQAMQLLMSEEGKKNRQTADAIIQNIIKSLSGPGTISDSDVERNGPIAWGDGTIQALVNSANVGRRSTQAHREGVAATYGTSAVERYQKGLDAAKKKTRSAAQAAQVSTFNPLED